MIILNLKWIPKQKNVSDVKEWVQKSMTKTKNQQVAYASDDWVLLNIGTQVTLTPEAKLQAPRSNVKCFRSSDFQGMLSDQV